MKIFLVGNVASMMINFRKELILTLVKKHDVYCLVSDYDDKSKQIIKGFGATPIAYRLNSKGINPIKDIFATIDLIKIIKSYKPDIVFSFFVKPVIFSTIAAKIAGVKRVVGMLEGLGNAFVYSGSTPPQYLSAKVKFKTKFIKFIQIFLYKISLPFLDVLIFLNNDDKKDLLQANNIKAKSVEVLGPIGVDLDKFRYSKPQTDQISFIFIARILVEKGVCEYLKAAKIVKEKYPDCKFYIYGSLDENNYFSAGNTILKEYADKGMVLYCGFVDDIYEKLKESSVFVLPSYREGFPRSTQEAMAVGRAVITTNVAGCKDSVRDGENGFLIPPYDYQILADRMQEFIKNPNLITQMGEKSAEIAKRDFDIYKINQKLIKIIFG